MWRGNSNDDNNNNNNDDGDAPPTNTNGVTSRVANRNSVLLKYERVAELLTIAGSYMTAIEMTLHAIDVELAAKFRYIMDSSVLQAQAVDLRNQWACYRIFFLNWTNVGIFLLPFSSTSTGLCAWPRFTT